MMISSFRQSLRREDAGQAIIFGAVALVVLAAGILTTAQLGYAIKEKIQLQNAADNAAYTTATMIARSLNLLSWMNRAIVAQHVCAMAIQSMVTHLDSIMVLLAQLCASLFSAAFLLGVVGRATTWIFGLGEILVVIGKVIGKVASFVQKLINGLAKGMNYLDMIIGPAVAGIGLINEAMYGIQVAEYALMMGRFGESAFSNDGDNYYVSALRGTAGASVNTEGAASKYNLVMNGIGAVSYANIVEEYDDVNLLSKFSQYMSLDNDVPAADERIANAKHLMTEIVNASRAGVDKNTHKNWESRREAGIGSLVDRLINGAAGGDSDSDSFIKKITSYSVEGTMMTDGIPKDRIHALGGKSGIYEIAKVAKYNPVFVGDVYHSSQGVSAVKSMSVGNALVSSSVVFAANKSWPGFIQKAMHWLSKGLGELLPESKSVGIQAMNKPLTGRDEYKELRVHCRFSEVGIAWFDSSDMAESMCDDACDGIDESRKNCKDGCKSECKGWTDTTDAEGNVTGKTCTGGYEWLSTKGNASAEDNESCKKCGDVLTEEGEDKDTSCDDIKDKCIEAAKKGLEEASKYAQQGMEEGVCGFPAEVKIDCSDHNSSGPKESLRHIYPGITKYLTFKAYRFNKKQESGSDPYPSFMAAANKLPKFMANSPALGFGGKDFSMQSIGQVGEGATALKHIDCDMKDFECKNKFNFDHMNADGVGLSFAKGMHSWARSQVYYHRPGTWAEPPNMFNPYWKPKLSPLAPMLTDGASSSLGGMGEVVGMLSGPLADAVGTLLSH